MLLAICLVTPPLRAREKDATLYGAGLTSNVPFPESEVTQAVQDVVQNGIIRGSKEYEREEYITGAEEATSVRGFPEWQEGGKVFYKLRAHTLDPRNFKESGDVGTLAVRYVVQAQGDRNTVLRIDAIFVEDFRRTVHPSNGSVEGAEYRTIHDHLEALQSMKQLGTKDEAAKRQTVNEKLISKENAPAFPSSVSTQPVQQPVTSIQVPTSTSEETPEEHLRRLRHEAERIVKSPGAPLKASPFQSAKTLASLPTGTDVLIVISTPYWFGVETHAGQHGWIAREQLESLP